MELIASTQYNDLRGTSAMDFHNGAGELVDLAKGIGIDTQRFSPIGIHIFLAENSFFTGSVICQDTSAGKQRIVSISFNLDWNDFKRVFKRLDVILLKQGLDGRGIEVDEELRIEDLKA